LESLPGCDDYGLTMARDFKSQVQDDVKNVFLNLAEFATIEEVEYFRDGRQKTPVKMKIPVVITEDGDSTKTWNKQESYQIASGEQTLMQKAFVLHAALEDFGQAPQRKRFLRVGKIVYQISTVSIESGMLRISLRVLKE
jgi:hypothetical protein